MGYYKMFPLLFTLGLLQYYLVIIQYYLSHKTEDIRMKSCSKSKSKKIINAPLLTGSAFSSTLLDYELQLF